MRTWIEINLTALSQNVKTIKSILPEGQQLGAVVKGNAYGHGLIPVSSFLDSMPEISWLFTAGLKEAIELRTNGIKKPICVMSYIDTDPLTALEHGIELPITNLHTAHALEKIAKRYDKQFPVHIKIDTGLSRLGIPADQASEELAKIAEFSHLEIKNIFTHMADNKNENPEYTAYQHQQFNHVIAAAKKLFPSSSFLTHTSSSSSLLLDSNIPHDIIRVGTSLYGLYKSANQEKAFKEAGLSLHPVLSWKSKIIEIKYLAAGTAISYGCKYITNKPTTLAVVPIGYWDGYPARLSGNCMVYIKNQSAQVLGIITMNMIMIDVTDIIDIAIDDEVTLIGNNPGITIGELAAKAGNINIEVLAQLNPEIERKELQNNITEVKRSSQEPASMLSI